MKHRLLFVIYGIMWTALCFFIWTAIAFAGFPKTREDLMQMGWTDLNFALQNIMLIMLPIAWIGVPIFLIIRDTYFKK